MPFIFRVLLCVVVYFSIRCVALVSDGLEPPKNPHLADSPWPMTHRNPYCQASSPYPGPTPDVHSGPVDHAWGIRKSVAVTLALSPKYENGESVIWTGNHKGVFKLSNSKMWDVISMRGYSTLPESEVSGAYTVLDRDGVFYMPHGNQLVAFSDSIPGDPRSPIKLVRYFTVPQLSWSESIIGLNLTYDGYLAFVSDSGVVGVISRDFKNLKTARVSDGGEVSNSIAIDEDGGIYVLTSKKMHRYDWKDKTLTHTWGVPYKSTSASVTGRLGTGSGTTPTLMGTGSDSDKLVVIADGQRLMHMVAFWRDTIPEDWKGLSGRDRRMAAEVPIRFGNPNATTSVTEQSLLVRGYDAVVVNNDYGKKGKSKLARWMAILNSNKSAPKGIEKFTWDPKTRTLRSAWVNRITSCPNGIPTMSAESRMFYCIGAYQQQWTFEALDWNTGKNVWRKIMGNDDAYNSFYAGTEVGWDSSLISGAFEGFLRMQ